MCGCFRIKIVIVREAETGGNGDTAAHSPLYFNTDFKFSNTREVQVHYYKINKIANSAHLLVIQSVSTQNPFMVYCHLIVSIYSQSGPTQAILEFGTILDF